MSQIIRRCQQAEDRAAEDKPALPCAGPRHAATRSQPVHPMTSS
ncbi:hypothetical protein ACFVWT_00030 [Arthrobacter sp. NPDC058288]